MMGFDVLSSAQIEAELCKGVARLRLSHNITQQQLAERAGISLSTVKRMEAGRGVSLDTFIRALSALGVANNLATVFPGVGVSPLDRVWGKGKERKRSRPKRNEVREAWRWDDD